MARGPIITDAVKSRIARWHRRHPKWTAKVVHEKVSQELHRENPELPPNWPGLSAVQKVLALIRKNWITDPQDEPWSLSALSQHPIPPEALPTVMSFHKKRLAEDDVLSIREALWTARLYKLIDPPDLVWDWAFLYALEEMVSKDLGKPFDSTRLDLEMIQDPNIARVTQTEIRIFGVAYDYNIDAQELKDACDEIGLENPTKEQIESVAKSGKFKKEAQDERTHTPEE